MLLSFGMALNRNISLQNTRYIYDTMDRIHRDFEWKNSKYHSLFSIHRFTHEGAVQQLFAFDIKQAYTFMNDFS